MKTAVAAQSARRHKTPAGAAATPAGRTRVSASVRPVYKATASAAVTAGTTLAAVQGTAVLAIRRKPAVSAASRVCSPGPSALAAGTAISRPPGVRAAVSATSHPVFAAGTARSQTVESVVQGVSRRRRPVTAVRGAKQSELTVLVRQWPSLQ